jgi:uncharacterized Zn-finger protein
MSEGAGAGNVAVDLVALCCEGCGGDVPIADAESVSCPYCTRVVRVPEAHRQAVRLVGAEDGELRHAEQAWQTYARATWPAWLAVVLAFPPAIVLAGSLSLALCAKFGVVQLYTSPRTFIGQVGLTPLVPLVALAVIAYWSSVQTSAIRLTRLALAARPGKVPSCRACGAPLAVGDGALFVRCPYCRTDSLVTLDALAVGALAENIERAEASAKTALESAEKRRENARRGAKVIGLVWLGLIGLLALWVLVPFVDHVLGLVALDMFALSTLTYVVAFGTLVDTLRRSGKTPRFSGALVLLAFLMAVASSLAIWIVAS